jgi:hypothetical protein
VASEELDIEALLVDGEELLQRCAVRHLGLGGGRRDVGAGALFGVGVFLWLLAGSVAADGDVRGVLAGDEDIDAQAGVLGQHALELDEFGVEPEEILRAADDPDEVDGGLGDDELAERGDHNGESEGNTGATSHCENVVGNVLWPARTVGSGHDDRNIGLACESSELHSLTLAGT